ncbi:hypothetical protein DMB45_01865 [Sanguibacteroides justesenii]|uniref:Uncharacterized protein n=1 Tax=Sanguibacteroides justesenii TaxID=1547597 RepID=A0AB34R734_9PORP|nr:hypothetical protein IE90_10475 [Sanguibacteroides justesenii]PXZ45199.1 hypothetical protein DMB45_01865 [Sanguibacteroides justesenii]
MISIDETKVRDTLRLSRTFFIDRKLVKNVTFGRINRYEWIYGKLIKQKRDDENTIEKSV